MTYMNPSEQFAARIPARGQVNSTTPFLNARGAFAALGRVFATLGHSLINASGISARSEQIEMLEAKSDAELAAMGLRRDTIAYHVFRDLHYC